MAGERIDYTAVAVDAAKSVLIEGVGHATTQGTRLRSGVSDRPRQGSGQGKLPDGAIDEVELQVASVVPFLVMKGMAMEDRRKAKDAYDLYFLLTNYPGGVEAIVAAFKPHLGLTLVKEGLEKLARKFATIDHVGPKDVAEFDEALDNDDRGILQRDAFEKVSFLLRQLGVG